ncbi:MAG: 30S ribosomal protein S9 [Candidatus Latescibacterota bacterium]|nr:MAG: 30S ribosomal protein S9 [Candidatus Latescibacterota bacterium]
MFIDATGRRKTSTARVRIVPGEGKRTVNGRPLIEYFPRQVLQRIVEEPFEAVGGEKRFDLIASVEGGGLTGQAGAIRLGIARALVEFDASTRRTLRGAGLLTRDPREVERKKYGMAGARKRFQFSKR